MEEDLYDEFGNYIGPAMGEESGGSEEDSKVMEESEISSHHNREMPETGNVVNAPAT